MKMRSPTKKTLDLWSSMTDGNFHGEVREKIAAWYQKRRDKDGWCLSSRDYKTALAYINKLHNSFGCIPMELCVVRNIVTNAMIEEIRKASPKVADKIENCL